MGDVDEGDAGAPLNGAQLGPHVLAQLEVERRQGLVQKHHLRLDSEGAGDGHTLLLPAGEFADALVACVRHGDHLQQGLGFFPACGLADTANLQPERNIFPDFHQREQGEVLENQCGGPLVGADAAHVRFTNKYSSRAGLHKAGHDAQDRRLAAARRTQEREKFTGLDGQ